MNDESWKQGKSDRVITFVQSAEHMLITTEGIEVFDWLFDEIEKVRSGERVIELAADLDPMLAIIWHENEAAPGKTLTLTEFIAAAEAPGGEDAIMEKHGKKVRLC